jgi:hypothetical protein
MLIRSRAKLDLTSGFFGRIHFHHEEMSTLMLDHLIDDNAIDINRDDVRFIQDLILSRDAEYVRRI